MFEPSYEQDAKWRLASSTDFEIREHRETGKISAHVEDKVSSPQVYKDYYRYRFNKRALEDIAWEIILLLYKVDEANTNNHKFRKGVL